MFWILGFFIGACLAYAAFLALCFVLNLPVILWQMLINYLNQK